MYKIISDGACDLIKEYVEQHDIEVVPFYVSFDGETYYKENIDIDHNEFYERMINDTVLPKSSLPSVQDYVDVFTKYASQGMDMVCICITTQFSDSFNSATNAKEIVLETYPNVKIAVIDSMLNTVNEGQFVNEAVKMRDAGYDFKTLVNKLEEIKKTGQIFFTVGSFEYLQKGGRLGKIALTAGDKIGIKPIIIMKDGGIGIGGITRSRKKALKKVCEMGRDYFDKNNLNKEDYGFVVGTGYDLEEAKEFRQQLEEVMGIKCDDSVQALIGTTVGTHTGPYPLGFSFLKKYDR